MFYIAQPLTPITYSVIILGSFIISLMNRQLQIQEHTKCKSAPTYAKSGSEPSDWLLDWEFSRRLSFSSQAHQRTKQVLIPIVWGQCRLLSDLVPSSIALGNMLQSTATTLQLQEPAGCARLTEEAISIKMQPRLSSAQYRAAQHSTVQDSTTQHSKVQQHITQWLAGIGYGSSTGFRCFTVNRLQLNVRREVWLTIQWVAHNLPSPLSLSPSSLSPSFSLSPSLSPLSPPLKSMVNV